MPYVIAAQLADLGTFVLAAFLVPLAWEWNPIARATYSAGGLAAVIAVKVIETLVILALVSLIHSRSRKPGLAIGIGLGAIGFAANTLALVAH